jgi:hypothetical protein
MPGAAHFNFSQFARYGIYTEKNATNVGDTKIGNKKNSVPDAIYKVNNEHTKKRLIGSHVGLPA